MNYDACMIPSVVTVMGSVRGGEKGSEPAMNIETMLTTMKPIFPLAIEKTLQSDVSGMIAGDTWDDDIRAFADAQCHTEVGKIRLIAFCFSLLEELEARGLIDKRGEDVNEKTSVS